MLLRRLSALSLPIPNAGLYCYDNALKMSRDSLRNPPHKFSETVTWAIGQLCSLFHEIVCDF